jgi:hypothetical protein
MTGSKMEGRIMTQYFVRVEAVNFGNSVYDTNDVSTIRGGSFLLNEAFHEIEAKVRKCNIPIKDFSDLGSAASVGIFSFESELEGDKLEETVVLPLVEQIREKAATFGTFVWSFLPASGHEPFTKTLQTLVADCHWKQYRQLSLVPPTERHDGNHCFLDGVRPESPESGKIIKGGKSRLVSKAVIVRRKEGQRLRNGIYKRLLGGAAPELVDDPEAWIVTNDLEELSRKDGESQSAGKVAFIYLDGNRFSRIRNKCCQGPSTYRKFQKKVQEELREPALKRLLTYAWQPENESFRLRDDEEAKGKIRLETLLWGGDEIEWVVPAWQALNVLELFFDSCEQCDADHFEGAILTHSAGVVFCHHDLPILKIREYAQELARIAKAGISKDVDEITRRDNRAAFLNIVSFDYLTGTLDQFYRTYFQPAHPKDFVLEAREIPLIKTHLPVIGQLMPTTKLHKLLTALQLGAESFDAVWKRILQLLPAIQKDQLLNAAQALGLIERPVRWFLVADLLRNLAKE